MKPKAVITQWVHAEVIQYLSASFRVVPNRTRETLPREELMSRAGDAQALMVFMTDHINEEFLEACPELRVIAGALKGWDNIDVHGCTRRGIWLTIVPDLLTNPTADLAVALLIGVTRRLLPGDRIIRSGGFRGWRPRLYGTELAGKCAGIIGMGALGCAIAKRLRAFDLRIVYNDTFPLDVTQEEALTVERVSLEALLGEADFIILALPLTPRTKHLINEETLGLMKPGSFLINPARGSLVVERAVAEALESGRLAGYAADAFEMEDWAVADRPRAIHPRLLAMSDCTLFTPHLGSAVDNVRFQIALTASRNMIQAVSGQQPEGAINDITRKVALPCP